MWSAAAQYVRANDELRRLPPVSALRSGLDSDDPPPIPLAERFQPSLENAERAAAAAATSVIEQNKLDESDSDEDDDVAKMIVQEVTDDMELIEQQSTSGWYYPRIMKPSEIWEGGVELGINGAQGNNNTLSLTAGANAKRTEGPTELSWDLKYLKAQNESVETQHNALMGLDYSYDFVESCYSWFVKFFGEYDEFKAFDLRLSLNSGAGFDFIKTDTTQLTGRFGAGWSREYNGPDDRYVPEATFGAHFECELLERQKIVFDARYLPEWSEFANFRMINDAHWKILLHEESDLHLKIGIVDRYDSTPNGAEANDLTYSLLLLWKI